MHDIGEVFAGFTIERMLGQGGMGTVYLARHPRLDRLTALKLLNRDLFADERIRARFEREADLAAGLDHPGIVTVFDRGTEGEQLWISMQYVDGVDAATVDPMTLPPERAVQIIEGVADALDYAHGRGVLHRDVKPANILLARSSGGQGERVFLTDFGIARLRADSTHLTQQGMFTATLAYASPEQMTGAELDHRSDQYSLACSLYWMFTGIAPFDSPDPNEIIRGTLYLPPPPLALRRTGLPPAMDAVLAAAMAKHPAARFDSCTAFATAARAALTATTPPVLPRPTTPPPGYYPPATPYPAQGQPIAPPGQPVPPSGRAPAYRPAPIPPAPQPNWHQQAPLSARPVQPGPAQPGPAAVPPTQHPGAPQFPGVAAPPAGPAQPSVATQRPAPGSPVPPPAQHAGGAQPSAAAASPAVPSPPGAVDAERAAGDASAPADVPPFAASQPPSLQRPDIGGSVVPSPPRAGGPQPAAPAPASHAPEDGRSPSVGTRSDGVATSSAEDGAPSGDLAAEASAAWVVGPGSSDARTEAGTSEVVPAGSSVGSGQAAPGSPEPDRTGADRDSGPGEDEVSATAATDVVARPDLAAQEAANANALTEVAGIATVGSPGDPGDKQIPGAPGYPGSASLDLPDSDDRTASASRRGDGAVEDSHSVESAAPQGDGAMSRRSGTETGAEGAGSSNAPGDGRLSEPGGDRTGMVAPGPGGAAPGTGGPDNAPAGPGAAVGIRPGDAASGARPGGGVPDGPATGGLPMLPPGGGPWGPHGGPVVPPKVSVVHRLGWMTLVLLVLALLALVVALVVVVRPGDEDEAAVSSGGGMPSSSVAEDREIDPEVLDASRRVFPALVPQGSVTEGPGYRGTRCVAVRDVSELEWKEPALQWNPITAGWQCERAENVAGAVSYLVLEYASPAQARSVVGAMPGAVRYEGDKDGVPFSLRRWVVPDPANPRVQTAHQVLSFPEDEDRANYVVAVSRRGSSGRDGAPRPSAQDEVISWWDEVPL
ncbi:serine/threonine-protein kinase [Nocardia sp. SSK8]|uniref:serine/threonine-protein kinase n=1 Tax=Nocardia sp. SSK8 TaxID=3120154 RepID=UPI0030080211